ncbi:LuxR C-terminal-related transcriptional regulator [Amycolatopsis sp. lyj-108]|uniref:LuxR C-terminal-related transcriptional regulator n=1 Tax=Amycolatopsis sp. lyj-108 TaxID=2789286 RepID=UPI00397B7AE5
MRTNSSIRRLEGSAGNLVARLCSLIAQHRSAVLVSGAAGMGKSWLARQLLSVVHADVNVLVRCRGLPDEPYVVVRELLRCLGEAGVDIGAATTCAEDGKGSYEVCARLRELLVVVAPVFVVVDDVDLADCRSLQVLKCCATRLPADVALMMTCGSGRLKAADLRWGAEYRVELEALSPLEIQQWAAESFGGLVPDRWAAQVHALTGGVPRFVAEVFACVRPEQGDPGGVLEKRGVPQAIADAVSERFSVLPVASRRIVDSAALLRGRFTADLLAEVCRVSTVRAGTALVRAADAGLVEMSDDGAFEFRPSLVRSALERMLSAEDRRRGHVAVVRALENRGGEALAELTHHARASGDLAAAARYAERAADRAAWEGEPADAVELLRQLLAEPGLPRRVRAALAGRCGRLALGSLAFDDTVVLLRTIIADDTLSSGVRGELRLQLGLLRANQAGEVDLGWAEIVKAVTELRRRPLLAARAMAALAMPQWSTWPVEEHLRWLREAERTTPSRGDPALLTAIAVNRAAALLQLGDRRAWEAIDALPQDGSTAEQRQELVRGYINLADAAISLGHQAAGDFLSRAHALTGQAPSYLRHMALANDLRLALVTGRWAGLADRARRHPATRTPRSSAESHLVLARLALATGEWDEAERLLTLPGLELGHGWYGPAVLLAAATRVRLAVLRGRLSEAVDEFAAAAEVVRNKGVWAWSAELVDAGVEALLRLPDVTAAKAVLAEFGDDVEDRDCPLGHALLRFGLGMTASAEGRLDDAVVLLADAAERLAALPRPYEEARAIEAVARCLFDLADTARAVEYASAAARAFARLGATWDAARCEHLLREHGGGMGGGPGRRGYGAVLSPREESVARLIVSGHTNRQIAGVLFLSPRTVERHVANILRKLGVRSRQDVRVG